MTHDAPLCAKCGRPLPVVMQRLYQGGPWTEVQNSVESEDGNGEVCGWPGCEVQEPSELRKALENLVGFITDSQPNFSVSGWHWVNKAREALAGDER